MAHENYPRVIRNESVRGYFPRNQFNVNQNVPMSSPPTRNISVQRFSVPPFPNVPPPFKASKFPGLAQVNRVHENSPVAGSPPSGLFLGPRMVYQPYSPNNIRFPPPDNQSALFGHGERFFVPWNERPPPAVPHNRCHSNRMVLQLGGAELAAGESFSSEPKETYQQNQKPDVKKGNMQPWMTPDIFEALTAKNSLHARARKLNTEETWSEFRVARNKLNSLIKAAKAARSGPVQRSVQIDAGAKHFPSPFSCDICDRAFELESCLQKHIKEHVKCNLEGCQFEAHPKVIALHRKMQHDTGYAKTILKLNNTEEIEKWRLERKRRFPTAENIKKRKAEQVEKTARGEVIEDGYFGKFKKPKLEHNEPSGNCQTFRQSRNVKEPMTFKQKDRRRSRKRQHRSTVELQQQRVNTLATHDVCAESDDDSHIRLTPFQGMLPDMPNILLDICQVPEVSVPLKPNNDDSGDIKNGTCEAEKDMAYEISSNTCDDQLDEDANGEMDVNDITLMHPFPITTPVAQSETACLSDESSNHLNSSEFIQSQFDVNRKIDEDSDDEAPTVIPFSQASSTENFSPVDDSCVNEKNSDTIRISAMPEKRTTPAVPLQNLQNGISPKQYSNFRRKSTLLEKLLAKEISHERNVLLQCIRHVINNDFFGVTTN